MVSTPGFLGAPVNFHLSVFIRAFLLLERSQWRMKKKWKKIMVFIVAINVVASQAPERRPTGTLNACPNFLFTLELSRCHKMDNV